jgi:hypothetical protein
MQAIKTEEFDTEGYLARQNFTEEEINNLYSGRRSYRTEPKAMQAGTSEEEG